MAPLLAFGAVFEVPLVMFVLIYLRILSAAFLRRHRRSFILINAVASALEHDLEHVREVLLEAGAAVGLSTLAVFLPVAALAVVVALVIYSVRFVWRRVFAPAEAPAVPQQPLAS